MTHSKQNYWVVLGASAGGLEALKAFLQNFNDREHCYLVVAQHLDPKHPTVLKELLARSTSLAVHLLEEDTRPKVGQVYIISPGHNATVEDGTIKLSPAAEIGPKPSIDLFLNSLATEVGEKSIAVILSGTGSDGAQGVMAVKSANGVVFAQDRKSAKYIGMPDAAIETGAVDLTLPPGQIAQKIGEFIQSSDKTLQAIKNPQAKSNLEKVFQRIFEQTGYDFSGYKLKTINRRIARRMAVHRMVTMDDYLKLLESSGREVESLFKDFLISVTAFFRDREPFQDLRRVVEALVARTPESATIRVWVPGCANGEEAYSIAILIHQELMKSRKSTPFQVFATDIDESALGQARKGYYSQAQIEGVDPEVLELFFQLRDGHYLISKTIRDKVVFARQNVITDPPFSRIDLISCRNLLIYFSAELQKRVMQIFHFALKPNGYLFLGRSESAFNHSAELFEGHIKKSQIFVRKNIALSQKIDQVQSANNYAHLANQQKSGLVHSEKLSVSNRIEKLLLDEIVPATVVIDGSGQVLHIRGDVNRYLNFPQGKIDTNILSLARDDIKVDIRALLAKAKDQGAATSQSLFYAGRDKELLFLHIRNISLTDEEPSHFLIAFLAANVDDSFFIEQEKVGSDNQKTNEFLVNEVALFKERLQTSIEELETTNEELQSTNEELQSANEELQSTNEELQTANEELQSTNEELSTVNQELEVKSFELEQVNSDLESMLENMNELVVVLDMRLRIIRFTNAAAKTFQLNRDFLNQTITTIGLPVDIPNLRIELLNVIDSKTEKTLHARFQSVVYKVRLVPYESDSEAMMSGVLIFFEDSKHRSYLEPEIDCIRTLEVLGDDLSTGIMVIDKIGVLTYANQQALNYLGYPLEEIRYKNIKMLMPPPYRDQHDLYLENYMDGKSKGLMGLWRDISVQKKNGDRALMKLKVDETWINAERHFLGRVLSLEEYEGLYGK